MRRIYIASSWKNKERVRELAAKLLLTYEKYDEVRSKALDIRSTRKGRLPW
jgi:hypothetical protein